MAIKYDKCADQRRYNAPHCNEVAIVFQNIDGKSIIFGTKSSYLFKTRFHNNNFVHTITKRISALHPRHESMTYPLIFPYGESGWHFNISIDCSAKRVTQMAYCGYRLSVRNEFNPFLNTGKLLQQYVVDERVKMESNRLKWI